MESEAHACSQIEPSRQSQTSQHCEHVGLPIPQLTRLVWRAAALRPRPKDIPDACPIDELSRENLTIRVARKLTATDVIEALCELVAAGNPFAQTVRQQPWVRCNGSSRMGRCRGTKTHHASLCFFRAAVVNFSVVRNTLAEISTLVLRRSLSAARSRISSLAERKCLVGQHLTFLGDFNGYG